MKVTILQLLASKDVLGQLNQAHGLSATCAFSISKNIKKISAELEAYDETRKKILEEYANKDSEGKAIIEDNNYKLTDEAMQEVIRQINELQQNEVELDLSEIDISHLDNANLSPAELSLIDFMIRE